MRSRFFGLWGFLVLLVGCVSDPYVWNHPTKNGHDLAAEKEQCEITAAAEYPSNGMVAAYTPGHTVRCYSLGNGARDCGSEYGSYYVPPPVYVKDGNVTPYPYPPMFLHPPPLYMSPSHTINGNVDAYYVPPSYYWIDSNLDNRERAIKRCLRAKGWRLERIEKKK